MNVGVHMCVPRPLPPGTLMLLALLLVGCPHSSTDAECETIGVGSISFHPVLPTSSLTSKAYLYVYTAAGVEVAVLGDGDSLTDIPAGPYLLGVGNVRGEDDGSGFVATYGLLSGTVSEVCLGDGETLDRTPELVLQPGSRHLWFSAGESLAAFAPESLGATATLAPDLRMDVTPTNDFRGFAFDPMGNLWAATSDTYGVRLLVFEPQDVEAGGAVEPIVTVTNDLFGQGASIGEIAFAPDGQLVGVVNNTYEAWVGAFGYDPSGQILALVSGETATAEPTWTATVDGLVSPADLAFDDAGRAWISDQDNAVVLRVDAFADEAVTPDARFTALYMEYALRGPTDLAFLPDGGLLVDYWTDGQLVELPASELEGTGDVTVVVDGTTFDVLALPEGLAVTGTGTQWYGNYPATLVSDAGITITLDGLPQPRDLGVN